MSDTRPATPGKVELYVCPVHGPMLNGVFPHADEWQCRRCFDANPRAAYRQVEAVEYVPRHQPEPGRLEERLEGMVQAAWEFHLRTGGAFSRFTTEQARERVASTFRAAGVPDLLAQVSELETERDQLVEAAEDMATWAEGARGHYGIEECGGTGQPATEWDDIQDGLTASARHAREVVALARAAGLGGQDA